MDQPPGGQSGWAPFDEQNYGRNFADQPLLPTENDGYLDGNMSWEPAPNQRNMPRYDTGEQPSSNAYYSNVVNTETPQNHGHSWTGYPEFAIQPPGLAANSYDNFRQQAHSGSVPSHIPMALDGPDNTNVFPEAHTWHAPQDQATQQQQYGAYSDASIAQHRAESSLPSHQFSSAHQQIAVPMQPLAPSLGVPEGRFRGNWNSNQPTLAPRVTEGQLSSSPARPIQPRPKQQAPITTTQLSAPQSAVARPVAARPVSTQPTAARPHPLPAAQIEPALATASVPPPAFGAVAPAVAARPGRPARATGSQLRRDDPPREIASLTQRRPQGTSYMEFEGVPFIILGLLVPVALPPSTVEPSVVADPGKRLGLDHFPGRPRLPLPCELIGEAAVRISQDGADADAEVVALTQKLGQLNKGTSWLFHWPLAC